MFGAIIPIAKTVLMGVGVASLAGSVVTLAQRRGGRGRKTVDLDNYTFFSEEYDDHVDFDDLSSDERAAVIENILSGELVLP